MLAVRCVHTHMPRAGHVLVLPCQRASPCVWMPACVRSSALCPPKAPPPAEHFPACPCLPLFAACSSVPARSAPRTPVSDPPLHAHAVGQDHAHICTLCVCNLPLYSTCAPAPCLDGWVLIVPWKRLVFRRAHCGASLAADAFARVCVLLPAVNILLQTVMDAAVSAVAFYILG